MILEKLLLLFASFFLLFIFYQQEKKTFLHEIVIKRPKFGFLIPIFFVLLTLLLLYLINPFIFYFLLFLGLSIPFIYSAKEEELNELAFLHFMLIFIYKYFFYFAILISSILFLSHAPIEAWALSFLQLEESFSHSTLTSMLHNLLKEVNVAKGPVKINKQVEAERFTLREVPKEIDKVYSPILQSFSKGIKYAALDPVERVKINSAFLIKQAELMSELKGFPSKNSAEKQLSDMRWTERDERIFSHHLPRSMFKVLVEGALPLVKPFSENSPQNEMITSVVLKQYPRVSLEEDKNLAKLATESFKILVEQDAFTCKNLSPTDQLQVVRINDDQSKLHLKIEHGVYVEETKGRLTASKGQDCRFFFLTEGHGSLERPHEGSHDATGVFYGVQGDFEVKYFYFDITSTPDRLKAAMNFCQSLENAEEAIVMKFVDTPMIQKAFTKEAIPVIDLTQVDYLLRSNFKDSTKEVIEFVHTLNPYAKEFKENGKPIIYFSISSSEKTVIIK